jgi:AraC-like DNA-binding protein
MLVSHRVNESERLGCRLATHALLHPALRVHAIDNVAIVSEDLLTFDGFARKGRLSRPSITVLLEGRARLGDDTRTAWLAPGDVAVLPAKASAVMRQECAPGYRAIAMEWETARRPERFASAAAPGALREASESLWRAIRTGERALPALEAWLDRASGVVPIDRIDLGDEVPEQTAETSAALDRALSSLAAQPMHVDLERALGLSSKQVARRVRDFNEHYGFNADSWRDTRNRRRLMVALVFLSAEGATLDRVAEDVGYRSASALCRAFADAGFPPPATVSSRLAELRGASP